MSQSICAYCKIEKPLTHEHLWPASLHSRLVADDEQNTKAFWLARLRKTISSEPQIRDVCAKCNNGVLSELDSYICSLYDNAFFHTPVRYEKIHFEYSYHQLKRWLLKMCFNSARIHNSLDLSALEILLPYILGKQHSFSQSTQLFLQLTFPQEIPSEEVDPKVVLDQPLIWYPNLNRVGFMYYVAHGIGQKLIRAIHLRSFTFFVAFWQPGGDQAEQYNFARVFIRDYPSTVLLRPSESQVTLECNGMGAWDSFKGSQVNQYIFKEDM